MASLGPEAWTLTEGEHVAGQGDAALTDTRRISPAGGYSQDAPSVSVREPLTLLDYLLLAWTIGWLLAAGWVVV